MSHIKDKECPIQCLIQIDEKICMLCEKKFETSCDEVTIGDIYGWKYCSDCLKNGDLRRTVLKYIETSNSIPCYWIYNNETAFNQSSYYDETKDANSTDGMRYIHFLDCSGTDVDKVTRTSECLLGDNNNLSIIVNTRENKDADADIAIMRLNYYDSIEDSYSKQTVSLANVFYHNPEFYKLLVGSSNLLNNVAVVIDYSDIPQRLKDAVEAAKLKADRCAQLKTQRPKEL